MINTRCLTEPELVASMVCCHRSSGHDISSNHNDIQHTLPSFTKNISTIFLGINGNASSSRPTWHVDIRYFFITDQVENKENEFIQLVT